MEEAEEAREAVKRRELCVGSLLAGSRVTLGRKWRVRQAGPWWLVGPQVPGPPLPGPLSILGALWSSEQFCSLSRKASIEGCVW